MSDAARKRHLFVTPSELPPVLSVGRLFYLPADHEWLGLFDGAVSLLFNEANWQLREDGVSIEDTIQVFLEAFVGKVSNYLIGSILPVTVETLPDYMLLCDGANYSGDDYPALYAVLDDVFKVGDGTFSVPNLQGRFVLGELPEDIIEGVDFAVGDLGGEYDHELTVDELAAHSHVQDEHNHIQDSHNHTQNSHNHSYPTGNTAGSGSNLARSANSLAGALSSSSDTATNQATTATNQATTATNQDEGLSEPHNNMPPFYVLRYAMIAR